MERLLRSHDFRRIQGSGRKVRSTHLLLLALPRRPAGRSVSKKPDPVVTGAMANQTPVSDTAPVVDCRFGLTVSRKVGNAVTRNRIKRWLREAIRRLPPPARGPWDLVLIPHVEAINAGYHALVQEVADLWQRIAR